MDTWTPTQEQLDNMASYLRSRDLFGFTVSFRGEHPRRSLTYEDSMALAEMAYTIFSIEYKAEPPKQDIKSPSPPQEAKT